MINITIKKISFLLISIFLLFVYKSINNKNLSLSISNGMTVHFIDVGQGDAILVNINNKNLLIDSGSSDSDDSFFDYLDYININSFDYVIATHPHEDHIGNMSKLIDNYTIHSFYAPKVYDTSKCFESMIDSLKLKNMQIKIINEKTNLINLGNGTKVTVYSPASTYYDENYNNYSPIIRIQFRETSFMFTGDAEEPIEKQVLQKYNNLECDVLKVGHHGSSTSSCNEFINSINPSVLIISVGRNNCFNHPSKEVLDLFQAYDNKQVFRTDINGTIVLRSDGKKIYRLTFDY